DVGSAVTRWENKRGTFWLPAGGGGSRRQPQAGGRSAVGGCEGPERRPREAPTSTEDWERNTVSEGAKPVTDSAAVRGADEHPQSRSARRPALAEVAAATRGPRRFVSRIGAIVPASFILITIAVSSSLGQPLRGGVEAAELIVWAAFTLMLLTPFIAAALVMLTARRGGLVWTTTLVYAVLTGLLGVGVDV